MKALKLVVLGILLFFAISGQAQISVNVNLGTPPQWGPAGYTNVQYYYLPDVEAYYDVPSSQFIYLNGGTWVRRANLPGKYRNYDLYNGYKVVMTDYRGNAPYAHFKDYKVKYAKGYKGHPQKNIGQKPGKGNSGAKVVAKAHPIQNKSRTVSKSTGHGGDKKGGKGNGKKK